MRHVPFLTLVIALFVTATGCGSGKESQSSGSGGGAPLADGGTTGSGGSGTGGSGTGGGMTTSSTSSSSTSTSSTSTSSTGSTTSSSTTSSSGAGGGATDAGTDAGDAGSPCLPNPCTQPYQTQCQGVGGVAVCSCDPGAHDDGMGGCTTNPCLPDPCTGAGKTTCTAAGTTGVCSCDTGYHDDGMGGCTTDPCTPNPCLAQNQACQVVGGQAQCVTPSCDDGNPCTTDTVVGGACVHTPVSNGTACATSACLSAQTCQSGACSGGTATSCDDGNPCTTDTCAGATGCAHTPVTGGTACNDGIACTTGDVCNAAGACAGTVTAACTATTCTTTTPLGGSIDIPVAQTTATITLGGQPLPATTEYGSSSSVYLVAKDTGEWHLLASFDYVGSPPALYGPTVNPRVVPGVYDVYYCHNCATSTTATNIADATDATDAFPNGLRVLQSNVVVGAGAAHIALDIPVAQTTATITLGGQPLPATTEYGSSSSLYLVAKDTGEWHLFASFDYVGSPPALYGPTVNPRVVPGTYDVYYCHNCATQGTSVPIADATDPTDAFPNGLRVLQSSVVIGSGAVHLAVDIPVAQTTATITLGGQPLPATTEYGSSTSLYLVARDTGEWHLFASFDYVGSPPALYGPTVTPRVVPGTYDVYYCHNCATSTTATNIADETDATDAFPNGLRVLQSGVVIGSGAVHLAVDIPVTPLAETVTLAERPLPSSTEYGSSATLYLRARDTGEWHLLASFDYVGSPPALYGPTVDPRLVPGTYDVLYCHNCATQGTSVPISDATDATDAFPNGLRVLQACVTVP